jgi:hypothetical protein
MSVDPLANCLPRGLRNALAEVERYRAAWECTYFDRKTADRLADWLEFRIRAEYGSGLIRVGFGLRRGLSPRTRTRSVRIRARQPFPKYTPT